MFYWGLVLLWVMRVVFENNCTVSERWNVLRVVSRLYGWVYKTLQLSPLVVEHSDMVVSGKLNRMFSQFSIPEIKVRDPVEDSDTGVPSSITVKMEYFCFSILLLWTLCRKSMRGETESIVLLIFVLLWCLNRRWMRGGEMGQEVLFRTSWNHIFFEPGVQPKK